MKFPLREGKVLLRFSSTSNISALTSQEGSVLPIHSTGSLVVIVTSPVQTAAASRAAQMR